MKRMLALAVLVAAATALALGQMADSQGKTKAKGKVDVEQALMQMERDAAAAWPKRDAATLDRILADDCIYQGPEGIETKAQVLAALKAEDYKVNSATLGDMKVRVFGDTAVVSGSADYKFTYKSQDESGHYTYTDVFVKRRGSWQTVASQATLIAKQ